MVRARDADSLDGKAALAELCRTYWFPIYSFARRTGAMSHDAEDLVQGFFAAFLDRAGVARADPTRGRFRSFLLGSFQHFRKNDTRRSRSLKRGGEYEIVSLEAMRAADERFQQDAAAGEQPEESFDRLWALTLLDAVLDSLRREYTAAGKEAWFDALKLAVWGGKRNVSYASIAAQLSTSEGNVRVAVTRLRRRFREALRSEVAQTVVDPAEIDDEMRRLLDTLRQ